MNLDQPLATFANQMVMVWIIGRRQLKLLPPTAHNRGNQADTSEQINRPINASAVNLRTFFGNFGNP
jgi:hypothetical protein